MSEDGQSRRPALYLFQGPRGNSRRVIVQADNKGRDSVDVSPGEPVEHGAILRRLIEALIYVRQIHRINRLHTNENPLTVRRSDQIYQLLVAQKVGANLSDPWQLCIRGDDIAQERFGAFDVNGKVVIDEKDYYLTAICAGMLLEPQKFVHHALV